MRKIILMMMALCAMTFVGCSKEEGNGGGSLVVDGVNLVGKWADITDDDDYYSDIIVFTANSYQEYESDSRFTFKDGYFYGCTFADFEHYGTWSAQVSGDRIIIAGHDAGKIKVIDNDNILWIEEDWYDEDVYIEKYQRVKGFK